MKKEDQVDMMIEPSQEKSFETRVVMLISALAMARLVSALIQDFLGTLQSAEIITDSLLLVAFTGIFIFIYKRKNFEAIHPLVAVFYTALLALNFVQFGGALGHTKYNYLEGVFITILFYNPPHLYRLQVFQIMIITCLGIWAFSDPVYFHSLNISSGPSYQDYLSGLVAIIVMTGYLKIITTNEINLYQSLNTLLSSNVSEAEKSKQLLIENNEVLKVAQTKLETELDKRTHSLRLRNDALEKYILYNTTKLQGPIENLKSSIDQLQDGSYYSELLNSSQEELHMVLKQIREGLLTKGQINRNEIARNGLQN